ncbi:MAG: hypothetical protein WKF97_22455 [Chitinophagaceae bacterium]
MQSTTSPLAIPLEKAYPPLRVVGERRETEVEKARYCGAETENPNEQETFKIKNK